MFKSIDEEIINLEGFSYSNREGDDEFVAFDCDVVRIQDEDGSLCCIYVDDIPKTIKALQAAYDYKKGQA